jgi:hypothetical protein
MGTNSTAMLIGMHNQGIKPDLILFADTGGERPHTYSYVTVMSKWLESVSFPQITIVKTVNVTLEQALIANKSLPSVAYGGFKTCSQRFKTEPQDKFINNNEQAKSEWKNNRKIIKAIGFDADEPWRAKEYKSDKYENWHPLLDWDWGRDECIEVIKKEGLPLPGKSSCFFCPNMKQAEIRELKSQYPELALRAIEMEENADLTNIKGLGRDWRWSELLRTGEMFDFPDRFQEMPCACYDG